MGITREQERATAWISVSSMRQGNKESVALAFVE